MDALPEITVVTVCYNPGPQVLERTMLSVLGQDYPRLEYIVIDGGSTDGSVEVIQRLAPRLARWVSEPDKGIFHAMTKGIDAASGEWVNFMNAGDEFFDPHVVSSVFGRGTASADVIYGHNLIHYHGGYKASHTGRPSALEQGDMPFCHQNAFTRLQVLKDYPFSVRHRILADLEQMQRIYRDGHSFEKVNRYVCVYDSSGVSSQVSWARYAEHCLIKGDVPSWTRYLALKLGSLLDPLRHGRAKFALMALRKPHKYSVTRDGIAQLTD